METDFVRMFGSRMVARSKMMRCYSVIEEQEWLVLTKVFGKQYQEAEARRLSGRYHHLMLHSCLQPVIHFL